MSDQPETINPNPWPEIIGVAARQVGMIGGAVVSLFGFVSAHDLSGLFAYVRSDDGIAAFGAMTTVGIAGYGYFRAWKARHKLVRAARAAPNDKFVVKGEATTT